jgi:hypothetical protein
VVGQNYRSDKYCLWEFCFPNRFLRLLVSQSFMTNLDVFTLANAPFPYITSLYVFYDKLKVFS